MFEKYLDKIPASFRGIVEAGIFLLELLVILIPLLWVALQLNLNEDDTLLFTFFSGACAVVAVKVLEIKIKKKVKFRVLLDDWASKTSHHIFTTTEVLGKGAWFLIKVALIIALIGLGIWIVVAIGPLWIIATLLLILVFKFI